MIILKVKDTNVKTEDWNSAFDLILQSRTTVVYSTATLHKLAAAHLQAHERQIGYCTPMLHIITLTIIHGFRV